MVFREESSSPAWFPLLGRTIAELAAKDAACSGVKSGGCGSDDAADAERDWAWEIADIAEKGLAHEIVTDFVRPLRRSTKLWRFHVIRSEDSLEHRLFTDNGDFVMHARVRLDMHRVELYLYDPSDVKTCVPSSPAFTMEFSKDRARWRIVQEKCENCQFAPRHRSCACQGKQQVAFMRHTQKPVGDSTFNSMECHIPGIYSDGHHVVWCPMLGRGDLGDEAPEPDGSSAHIMQRLATRSPAWNDQMGCLVMDFKGRNIIPSPKNFQLSLRQKPDHVICQFGKVGKNTFALDVKYPLSVVQAFGLSLATLFWQ